MLIWCWALDGTSQWKRAPGWAQAHAFSHGGAYTSLDSGGGGHCLCSQGPLAETCSGGSNFPLGLWPSSLFEVLNCFPAPQQVAEIADVDRTGELLIWIWSSIFAKKKEQGQVGYAVEGVQTLAYCRRATGCSWLSVLYETKVYGWHSCRGRAQQQVGGQVQEPSQLSQVRPTSATEPLPPGTPMERRQCWPCAQLLQHTHSPTWCS